VQRRLAYAVESRSSYGARDAVGTNLGARNSDYNRGSHNDIYSWAYLEVSQQGLREGPESADGSIDGDIGALLWSSSCHIPRACIQTSSLNWP
jgi:hypothetical protein